MVKLYELLKQDMQKKLAPSSEAEHKIKKIESRKHITTNKTNHLSISDLKILNEYKVYAEPLETGERAPKGEKEKYFIKVCRGLEPPITDFQRVYLKYMKIKHRANIASKKHETLNKQINSNLDRNTAITSGSVFEKHQEDALSQRRKENGAAVLKSANRRKGIEKGYLGTNIPECEEGYPTTEFGSREDHKKMRARDWGDMKRRQKE